MKPRPFSVSSASGVIAFCALAAVAVACTTDASASSAGVGNPCTPALERDATFSGFDEKEVNVEIGTPSCATAVCLVNHFRGRVSCPYGQAADGAPPPGGSPCLVPGQNTQVTGGADPRRKAQVSPQCLDRAADRAVYCSCRCANDQGRNDDGASYCACPSGFECTPLVTSIGASGKDVAGSYCIKRGTAYDVDTACSQGDCDPVSKTCG